MKKHILIIDTSILCVWLQIPGMEECGRDSDKWTFKRVDEKVNKERKDGTEFVLPIATIIETGNHIAHIKGDKYKFVNAFADLVEQTIDENSPWIAFSRQSDMLQGENLRNLIQHWRETAIIEEQSLGDASIADVAKEFLKMDDCQVEIFTGDYGLKKYENPEVQDSVFVPRRRK